MPDIFISFWDILFCRLILVNGLEVTASFNMIHIRQDSPMKAQLMRKAFTYTGQHIHTPNESLAFNPSFIKLWNTDSEES
jgi:hypothetical protein